MPARYTAGFWEGQVDRTVLVTLLISTWTVVTAAATEWPTVGLLYNTSEVHSVRYECHLVGNELECSFVQTAVRPKAKPEELTTALDKARSDFPAFLRELAKECKGVDEMYNVLVLGRPPVGADTKKFAEATAAMHSGQKSDMAKMIGSWREMCRNPTEANFLEFARTNHDRDSRTCQVSANPYSQRFRRVNQIGPWVVVAAPFGPCGVVDVSRFEEDRVISGLVFWRYHAKKVVTNPAGEIMGLSCGKLDEREYIYDWRSKETYLRCDYINFSPL